MTPARISAVSFFLWGALHVVGGAAILFTLLQGPNAGYDMYANSAGDYPPLAGAILAMNSLNLVAIGAIVCVLSMTHSWRGRIVGALINIALAGAADIGLFLFLVPDGFVSIPEASIGGVLFLIGLGSSAALFLRPNVAPEAA